MKELEGKRIQRTVGGTTLEKTFGDIFLSEWEKVSNALSM